MNYILLAFISIAVLRGIISVAMGLFWFLRRSRTKNPSAGEPRAVIIRSTVPLIIAAILAMLYFKQTLTAYELLFMAMVLFGCELGVTVLMKRKYPRQPID